MMINYDITAGDLLQKLERFWILSGEKILKIESEFDPSYGAPVVTIKGKYSSRGWTEWTQGFQFGSALLQFDATGDETFLKIGRENTIDKMAFHISHTGVHDHGFNIVSTYGNLLRLMNEGRIAKNEWEKDFYEMALKISGAVQSSRWSKTPEGGFIYSFNGPHSLFVDAIRSCRILMLAHGLGHFLAGENDSRISLLRRGLEHLITTARYSVYYNEKRDIYDEWGRTAHESLFNSNDGNFRCPNSQQGYSGFSTWTRGLAWAMLGFAEELELIDRLTEYECGIYGSKEDIVATILRAAQATCDFYNGHTPADGIPYWDTGAPGLIHLGDYFNFPANPHNDFEPVDSSAAAIAAQALLRLGHYFNNHGNPKEGSYYWQAGLTVMARLLDETYLAFMPEHQGLLLHSVYHRPNGWDYIPEGYKIPCNESSMWGDYHIREAALYLYKIINGDSYYTFFNGIIK